MNIGNIMTRNASQYGSKPALIFEGKRLGWQGLDERVNQLAHALMGQGLQKGDKVAVLSENVPGVVETSFACAKAGAVYFPLMAGMAPGDILHLIDLSDTKVLVFHTDFRSLVEEMRSRLPKVKKFVRIGDNTAPWASLKSPRMISACR